MSLFVVHMISFFGASIRLFNKDARQIISICSRPLMVGMPISKLIKSFPVKVRRVPSARLLVRYFVTAGLRNQIQVINSQVLLSSLRRHPG